MITLKEVKLIVSELALQHSFDSEEDLLNDISGIVYRSDSYDCGCTTMKDRHIDIEFSYGECYEVHEKAPSFKNICAICNLKLSDEEIIIYQKDMEAFESNNDALWDKFMCFAREYIPYEEQQLNCLTKQQKAAVIAFLYCSEVMGEGHIGFRDLYGQYLSNLDVIEAFKEVGVSDKYIKILEEMPQEFIPVSDLVDRCDSEEAFEMEMERLDELYNEFDNRFYQYGNEEVIDKIVDYVRQHYSEFFG